MFPTLVAFSASVVSQPFKRSQLGLFQGKTKQYGNNVPFSKHKTRRTWLPNVQRKRLASDIIGEDIRVKLTTRALRTIKKHKGLDNYVFKTRSELLGWEGMRIRLMIRDQAEKSSKNSSEVTERSHEGNQLDQEALATAQINAEKTAKRAAAQRTVHAIAHQAPYASTVRAQREIVTQALGLSSLASAKQTIRYLKQKTSEAKKILASPA